MNNEKLHNQVALTKEEELLLAIENNQPIPISLTNNYAFHRVFTNPEVSIGFLAALLHMNKEDIKSIQVEDPIREGDSPSDKTGILDVSLTLNDNQKINLEMQAANHPYWRERSLFYLCRVYIADLARGDDYRQLKISIHVSILNFNLLKAPGFHHHFRLWNTEKDEMYSDKLQIHVIELSKLDDPYSQEDQELYYWAKMIAAENLEVMHMQIKDDPCRQTAYDMAMHMSLDKAESRRYLRQLLAIADQKTTQNYFRELGMEEGLKAGKAEGLKAGKAEGLKAGKAEGLKAGKAEGLKAGKAEGIKLGMLRLQLQQICGKLAQGKTLAETAADLLSSEDHLRPLYEAAKAHPDYSIEQLAELVSEEK